MLKLLRNRKTAKKIWIGLAVVIIPPFIFWGLGGALRGKDEASFAGKLYGKKISFLEYKNAYDAVRIQAFMQFGENFSEIQKYLNLESQAWTRLILLHEAKKRKITATDKEVIRSIEANPYFQRKGQFDNRLYNESLQYVFHIQARIFEENLRQNIIISRLYDQVIHDVKISDEEVKNEYQKLNEEINLYYIAGIPADFEKGINPSEEEIKRYFELNSLEFKAPPTFNLEYITVDDEKKVQELSLLLSKNKDLSRAAKELGVGLKETGMFTQADPIPGIGWSPDVLNLIAQLKVGEISKPMALDKNYYFIKIKEKKEAFVPEFEKIKDKVAKKLKETKAEELAQSKINACMKKLELLYQNNPKKSIDLPKIAKEFGLKSDTTGLFKYGSYIEGIGSSDNLWSQAKGLKEKQFSKIIRMPTGFYIVKLKSTVPVDEKKFEAEKAEFSKKMLLTRQQEVFGKFVEELKLKAQQ